MREDFLKRIIVMLHIYNSNMIKIKQIPLVVFLCKKKAKDCNINEG